MRTNKLKQGILHLIIKVTPSVFVKYKATLSVLCRISFFQARLNFIFGPLYGLLFLICSYVNHNLVGCNTKLGQQNCITFFIEKKSNLNNIQLVHLRIPYT